MTTKSERNPHCPVLGCRTRQPRLASVTTQELHHIFSDPATLCQWVKSCIVELIESATDDANRGRFFAYLTRWRQPEEMYYRALYILFIAEKAAIPHIVSGALPNSFSAIWRAVNRIVFEGRGTLDSEKAGLSGEQFTAMDILNNSAHASLATMATCIAIVREPDRLSIVEKHLKHWKRFCDYLHYMEGAFRAGKAESDVLVGVKNLHKNEHRP